MTVKRYNQEPRPAGTPTRPGPGTPGPAPMTPAQFGAALPTLARGQAAVSPQMVRAWIRQGMPATHLPPMTGKSPRGAYVINDVPAALAWLRAHRTHWSGRGGKRGEQQEGIKGSRDRDPKPEPRNPKPETRPPYSRPPPDAIAAAFDAERAMAEAEGREPDEVDYSVRGLLALDPARCLQLKIIEEILHKRSERLKLEGGLIDAGEARKAWIRVLESARRTFADVGRLSVVRIASVAKLTDNQRAEVRRIIDDQTDEGLRRLMAGDPGARSADE